jgi:uncharacterized protein YecE (DUF72 family)
MKNLKDTQESLHSLLSRVEVLGKKLGPILFQLPPRWRFNADRFYDFLESLPTGHRYVFEFRDESWLVPEVYEAMKMFGAAFCIYDLDGYLSPKEITADFIYLRLHGPESPYRGKYSSSTLSGWVGAFTAWIKQSIEIFCFFDNDQAGYAPQNALELQGMITT